MYKPGNESAAPPVTSPYQARLDWQLWQAAQGPQRHSPWFTSLVHRLLQGKEDGKDFHTLRGKPPCALSHEPPFRDCFRGVVRS